MFTIFEIRRFTTSFGTIATKRSTVRVAPQKSKEIHKMYLNAIKRYVDKKVDKKLGFK